MRLVLRFLDALLADWLATLLFIVGVAFVLAQVVVLRKRYLYIGCLGLGCLATAVRRGADAAGTLNLVLVAVQALAFAYAAVLMVKHSMDNLRELEEASARNRARMLTEMERIVERAKAGGPSQEAAPNGGNSSPLTSEGAETASAPPSDAPQDRKEPE